MSSLILLIALIGQTWHNHDGLSLRQHAEQVHGYDTTGMTDAEISKHNSDYHNRYGGYHHHAAEFHRSQGLRKSTQSRTYTRAPVTRKYTRPFLFQRLRYARN